MTVLDRHAGPTRTTLRVSGRDVTLLRGGEGPTLLYLHGLCDVHAVGPDDQWTPFLAHLAAHFDVTAPALPGYNASTGLEDFDDVEDYVWHLVDVCQAAGVAPAAVVGHSLGGWFAAELALRRPELVRALVLLGPLGVHVDGAEVPLFFGAVAPRGIGGAGEARSLLFAEPEGAVARRCLPDVMTTPQQLLWFAGLAGAARLGWKAPHFQSRKLTQRLGRVRVPTLVVRGREDVLVSDEAGRAWARSIPGARLVEVTGAGHCLVLEQPGVAAEVEGFVDGDAPSREGQWS
ncbi:MAG TPA: alpha/beta hydrolase [Acidimicrobiales bacterium]|nr:alpha/beta hydrolase [Acidimicrobiales bacterium]